MMSSFVSSNDESCPRAEVAAYVDGELTADAEAELDAHLAGCPICVAELNAQKQFLRELDLSLKSQNNFEMPADFTRVVVTNAESRVAGVRGGRELMTAAAICVVLGLFATAAIGPNSGVLQWLVKVFEGVAAVGTAFGHLLFNISFGTVVIVRSIVSGATSEGPAPLIGTVVIAMILFIAAAGFRNRLIAKAEG